MRFKIDLQFFGGRGATSSGGGGGGGQIGVIDTTSLISAREGKPTEVDDTLKVLKDIENQYGVQLEDVRIATLDAKSANVMAYYDNAGNLAVNQSYFNTKAMNSAYDACVKSGYHPPRGNKSGLEAVVAHEVGHALTDKAGGAWGSGLDSTASKICKEASKNAGYSNKSRQFISKVSKYGSQSYSEAVAEAFADVYCNGRKASKESTAIVNVLNKYLGGRK